MIGWLRQTKRDDRLNDARLMARLIGTLAVKNSPWHVEHGEVYVNCDKRVRGQKAIAELMGIRKPQLGLLCRRDPFLQNLLRPDGKWATTVDRIFCARVRHERYLSAQNSLKRRTSLKQR